MLTELRLSLRPALVLLAAFTLLLGLAYPLTVTGIAGAVMPEQAGGSLITDKGRVIGSALIGQDFTGPGMFHPRPSAAGKGYDAAASSGSNLAPGSQALADRVGASVKALRDDGVAGAIPADLVTTSGSGLDPDLSPAAALAQVPRIASARGLAPAAVAALVTAATRAPVFGEPHVNVLALNRELDRISAEKAAKSPG